MNKLELGVQATATVADAAVVNPGQSANKALVSNGSNWLAQLLVNANIDPAAAIAYSKLALAGSVVNNDVATGAAIAYAKLALAGSIVNADVATAAAIALSKLAGYPTDATKFARGDGTWAVPGMTQICDLTLGGSQASFDTNTILGGNIPQTYNHLKLVLYLRGDAVATACTPILRFNNDSGANYNWLVALTAGGGTGGQSNTFPDTSWSLNAGTTPAASSGANSFGFIEITIPHYRNSTQHKQGQATFGADTTAAATGMWTGNSMTRWKSTAAITRLAVSLGAAGNYVTDSRFTLYGLL